MWLLFCHRTIFACTAWQARNDSAKRDSSSYQRMRDDEGGAPAHGGGHGGHGEEFEFGEVWTGINFYP